MLTLHKEIKYSQFALLIAISIGIVVSITGGYVSGFNYVTMGYGILNWIFTALITLLVNKLCLLLLKEKKDNWLLVLPTLLLVPLFLKVFEIFSSVRETASFYHYIYLLQYIIQSAVIFIVFNRITLNKNIIDTGNTTPYGVEEAGIVQESSESYVTTGMQNSVAKSNTPLDKVIASILARANGSNKIIIFSLITMIVIVIIGGSASFGTVALSEVKKIRELESERLKMLEIVNLLQTNDTAAVSTRNKEVKNIIAGRYGNDTSYKSIIENIEKQSAVSWPDIVMRITIAALTLFLVQLFFHIYKYNQQQASHLFTKAETLELYKETGASQDELRSSLLSKVDFAPGFEKTPSPPTEQLISAISRGKEGK